MDPATGAIRVHPASTARTPLSRVPRGERSRGGRSRRRNLSEFPAEPRQVPVTARPVGHSRSRWDLMEPIEPESEAISTHPGARGEPSGEANPAIPRRVTATRRKPEAPTETPATRAQETTPASAPTAETGAPTGTLATDTATLAASPLRTATLPLIPMTGTGLMRLPALVACMGHDSSFSNRTRFWREYAR